jgi:hypothetical protein
MRDLYKKSELTEELLDSIGATLPQRVKIRARIDRIYRMARLESLLELTLVVVWGAIVGLSM